MDVREWKNVVTNVNERGSSAGSDTGFAGSLGGSAERGVVPQRVSLATSFMKMNGDGRPATGHNAV